MKPFLGDNTGEDWPPRFSGVVWPLNAKEMVAKQQVTGNSICRMSHTHHQEKKEPQKEAVAAGSRVTRLERPVGHPTKDY